LGGSELNNPLAILDGETVCENADGLRAFSRYALKGRSKLALGACGQAYRLHEHGVVLRASRVARPAPLRAAIRPGSGRATAGVAGFVAIAAAVMALPVPRSVLDGEAVAHARRACRTSTHS
jgi:hypothetical protein